MDAILDKIIWLISLGNAPAIIQSGDTALIYSGGYDFWTGGFVYSNGELSEYASFKIEETKSGTKYIIANNTVFGFDQSKPCEVSLKLVEKEIEELENLKEWSIEMCNGDEEVVTVSRENAEFFINNLKRYIEKYAKKQPV